MTTERQISEAARNASYFFAVLAGAFFALAIVAFGVRW
jgi:hypothetical protein